MSTPLSVATTGPVVTGFPELQPAGDAKAAARESLPLPIEVPVGETFQDIDEQRLLHHLDKLSSAHNEESRQLHRHLVIQQLTALKARDGEESGPTSEIRQRQASVIDQLNEVLSRELLEEDGPAVPGFFDKLIELINLIGGSYLDVYQNIVQQYSLFFQAFNSEITSKLKDWMEATNEGKEIKLDVKALREALEELINSFNKVEPFDPLNPGKPSGVLFPGPPERSTTDKVAAEKWCKALGLDPTNLKDNLDGTFSVMLDLGPLKQMLDDLPEGDSVQWDSALFQSWQTGFNAQGDLLKNRLQEYTQKYSSANSTHDNFIKTLSSHLNQFMEMLKAMTHT